MTDRLPSTHEPPPIDADDGASAEDSPTVRPVREPGDLVVALSPRQIIGGFAVVAGLIVMLRRRKRDRD